MCYRFSTEQHSTLFPSYVPMCYLEVMWCVITSVQSNICSRVLQYIMDCTANNDILSFIHWYSISWLVVQITSQLGKSPGRLSPSDLVLWPGGNWNHLVLYFTRSLWTLVSFSSCYSVLPMTCWRMLGPRECTRQWARMLFSLFGYVGGRTCWFKIATNPEPGVGFSGIVVLVSSFH